MELVCRCVKVPEFGILKKSCVEVIQHRLLRNLQDADFVKSKDFPTLLPVLYSFIDFCTEKTEAKGPLLQHLKEEFEISAGGLKKFCFCTKFVPKIANSSKAETNRYLNKFHEERRQRLTLLLDSEEWRAAEVPRELQEAVDAVLAQGQGHTDQRTDKPKRPG